jgi:hypothetical protein
MFLVNYNYTESTEGKNRGAGICYWETVIKLYFSKFVNILLLLVPYGTHTFSNTKYAF